jgi:hypothetical protein
LTGPLASGMLLPMTNEQITVTFADGIKLSFGRKTDPRIKSVSTFAGRYPLVLCRSQKAADEMVRECQAWGVPEGLVRFEKA